MPDNQPDHPSVKRSNSLFGSILIIAGAGMVWIESDEIFKQKYFGFLDQFPNLFLSVGVAMMLIGFLILAVGIIKLNPKDIIMRFKKDR